MTLDKLLLLLIFQSKERVKIIHLRNINYEVLNKSRLLFNEMFINMSKQKPNKKAVLPYLFK